MSAELRFTDLHPEPVDMRADVIAGLSQRHKRLSPKYFYDLRGRIQGA